MGLLNIQETINQTIHSTKEDSIKSRIRQEIEQEEKEMQENGFWYWHAGQTDDDWIEFETNRRYEQYLKEEKVKRNPHYFDNVRMKESQKWALKYNRR